MKNNKKESLSPDAEVHDEVYFRHASGHKVGRVCARGKHGCVVESDGQKHKVLWDDYLGHKTRVKPDVKVIDQGDDGLLVEDGQGKRRFVHDPLQPMAKSLMPTVLFFTEEETLMKAQTIKNRPGLALKDITDSRGRQSKHWVRTGKPETKERHSAAPEPEGDDRVGKPYLAGSKVSFKIGSLTGKGTIVGNPGNTGAYVKDDTGHKHRVRWADMGDVAGDKDGAQAAPNKAPDGGESPARVVGLFSQDTASLPSRVSQPVSDWASLQEKGEEGLGQFKAALGKVADKLGLRTDVGVDDLKGDHVTSKDGFLFIGPLKVRPGPSKRLRLNTAVTGHRCEIWSAPQSPYRRWMKCARQLRRLKILALSWRRSRKTNSRTRRSKATAI